MFCIAQAGDTVVAQEHVRWAVRISWEGSVDSWSYSCTLYFPVCQQLLQNRFQTLWCVLSGLKVEGLNLQTRYVPGIKLETLWWIGQSSNHWYHQPSLLLFLMFHTVVSYFKSILPQSGHFLAHCLLVVLTWNLHKLYAIFSSCLISDFSFCSSVFFTGLGLCPIVPLLFCKHVFIGLQSYTLLACLKF